MDTSGLARVFADLSDEALLDKCRSGTLTEEAVAVARAELVSRGVALPEESVDDPEPPLDELEPEDLVAVVRGVLPLEARLIQGFLESEGIAAFVADENLMNALPLWQHAAYGGARVLVRTSSVDEAHRLLAARKNDEYELDDEA